MNSLKINLFPIIFLYHLIQFYLSPRSILSTVRKLKEIQTMKTFNRIQNTNVKALVKMSHKEFCDVCNEFYLDQDKSELQNEVGTAKIFYVQALRNKPETEKRFPQQREMVKEQINHFLLGYIETQNIYNLHLQAEINAGDSKTYAARLEALYAQK